jgi:hypothetical protein
MVASKGKRKSASGRNRNPIERKVNALHQRLARLPVHQANQFLGENSKKLLMAAGGPFLSSRIKIGLGARSSSRRIGHSRAFAWGCFVRRSYIGPS